MLYMVTFTINIPPMLADIPYMDPMRWEDLGRSWEICPMVFHISQPHGEHPRLQFRIFGCVLCSVGLKTW